MLRRVVVVVVPGITDLVGDMLPALVPLQAHGAVLVPLTYTRFDAADSMEHLAATVWRHVVDAYAHKLRRRRLVLLGFSMGSFVVQEMLKRTPDGVHVAAAVLVGAAPPGSMRDNVPHILRGYPEFCYSEEAETRSGTNTPAVPLRRGVIAAAYLLAGRPRRFEPEDRVPVLVIHGTRDSVLPADNAHALKRMYHADLLLLPGARHNVFHDRRSVEAIQRELGPWLVAALGLDGA
jgi:pimeloyl-ACP methyl ester carboxylesterase